MASLHRNGLAVLFDSNFLMAAARHHFDILNAVERKLDAPFVRKILTANLRELRTLSHHGDSAVRREARVALRLADGFETVRTSIDREDPDDSIVAHARKSKNTIVATNDTTLRRRLRQAGSPVMFLRSSGELDLSGYEG